MEEVYVDGNEITEIRAIIPDLDVDDVKSRTSFTTGPYGTVPNPVWIVGDSIGIYPDEGDQLSFRITTGGKTCPFSGGGWAMKASSSYTAYSPFQRSYYFKEKSALPVNMLGQTQKGNDNSAHLSAYDILIAKGDKPSSGSLNFQFTRQVALVRMELTAPCAATWKSITLKSNAEFTTQAEMNLSLATPTITATAQSNTVTLALENVVTTSNNLNIIAYMMLLPVDLTGKTLTAELMDSGGNVYTANAAITNNKTQFAANAVRWISATFETDRTPYVTFMTGATSGIANRLSMSKSVSTLEYSVGGSEWTALGTTSVLFGGEYGELRLRGKSLTGTEGAHVNFSHAQEIVHCTGDIRTLVDYENYETVSTANAKFSSLFSGCSALGSAPALPATTLAESCYSGMFWGCTALVSAPELPATILAENCYIQMFLGCTSLATGPELPAKTLAEGCYAAMFVSCSSLTVAPALPATVLTEYCYQQMFQGCSQLTQSPKLPATILAFACYTNMFTGCEKLNKVTMLATDISAKGCLYGWLDGVSSSGTFIKAKEMTSLPSGASGIPTGWTVVDYEE